MGLFRKKGKSDTLDFTELEKRGIIRPSPAMETNNDGIVDFASSSSPSTSSTPPNTSSSTSSGSSPLGFLSSLASASTTTTTTTQESPGPITDSLRTARHRQQTNAEVNELKIKLEDNDYKLSNLADKIRELEEKINSFEAMR
jgi:TolA-binding protein